MFVYKINVLQELKGNIRVFCRVRPLLSNESGAVSYPNNGENIGRGVELMHNSMLHLLLLLSICLCMILANFCKNNFSHFLFSTIVFLCV